MSRFYVSVPLFLLLSLDLLIVKNIPFFQAHRLTAHLILKASLISKLPLSPPSCNADPRELSEGVQVWRPGLFSGARVKAPLRCGLAEIKDCVSHPSL